jgi:hypothetical protein
VVTHPYWLSRPEVSGGCLKLNYGLELDLGTPF